MDRIPSTAWTAGPVFVFFLAGYEWTSPIYKRQGFLIASFSRVVLRGAEVTILRSLVFSGEIFVGWGVLDGIPLLTDVCPGSKVGQKRGVHGHPLANASGDLTE